jgi:hypothetical protein
MNLLIGSRALNFWCPEHKINTNTDWDIISDYQIDGSEFHDRKFLNNSEFEKYASSETVMFNDQKIHVVNMIGLTIIKRSHLWRDLSFDKHITHYHKHLVQHRSKFTIQDEQVLQERVKLTKQEFPQGNPKLNQTVDEFFDDAVTKKYNHDYLHEILAFYDKPLYTKLQHDDSSAWCEKSLWDNLSHEDKLKCISEETYVIATERFMIPKAWNYPAKLAYIKSLNKVSTTLCSGWFRDYAIDHYSEIMNLFNIEKFNNTKNTLKE